MPSELLKETQNQVDDIDDISAVVLAYHVFQDEQSSIKVVQENGTSNDDMQKSPHTGGPARDRTGTIVPVLLRRSTIILATYYHNVEHNIGMTGFSSNRNMYRYDPDKSFNSTGALYRYRESRFAK